MKPGIPWSVKGIEPDVREAAKQAARRSGMTLGEWLNSTILGQAEEAQDEAHDVRHAPIKARGSTNALERTASRLEDIAEQLSMLSRRESATAQRPQRTLADEQAADQEALQRVLARVESNERQTVEAFTAVNDRLSVIGRQLAQPAKTQDAIRLEDQPAYTALEKAVRNIVEHMEASEKRNRDNFRSLQDRLSSMSAKAAAAPQDEILRQAPAFTQLESRFSELVRRVEQAETSKPQAALPDLLRKEIADLADRIDTVRETAEALANRAQTQAVQASQEELRAIEQRIIGLIREAKTSLAGNAVGPAEMQRLRGEIERLNARIDEAAQGKANGSDVQALRAAIEQLSTRVAQGPDLRPLADMDKRIVDLSQRLERSQAGPQSFPQLAELERRMADLDRKLNEALSGQHVTATELADRLADVTSRVESTEQQLTSLEAIERAVNQLFDGMEQQKEFGHKVAMEAAESAANRVAQQMAAQVQQHSEQQDQTHFSLASAPEITALQQGLHAVRQAADSADLRNQETLQAVHETLEQIVTKLTELETAAIGQRLSDAIASEPDNEPSLISSAGEVLEELPIWPDPSHDPDIPLSSFPGLAEEPRPQQENPFEPTLLGDEPEAGSAENPFDATVQAGREAMQAGAVQAETDDFIAAARKAAQSSIHQKSILGSVAPELARVSEIGSRKLMSFGFLKRRGADKAAKKPNPGLTGEIKYPPGYKPANENSSKKRKLIIMGLALLLVASAFTVNMMGGFSKVKLPAAPASIEQPVTPLSSSADEPADATESLPADDEQLDGEDPGAADDNNSQSNASSMMEKSAGQESLLQADVVDSILTSSAAPLGQSDDLAALIAGEPQSSVQQPAAEAGTTALREAAAMGNASAQFVIATRYLNGEQGAPQDDAKAAYWYGRAAAQGLAPAQYRLGTLYERGKGVARDLKAALDWYASLGNTKAMHNAAVLAASKDGQEPDYFRAYKWFSLGAAHGLKDSQFNLAVLLERGLGTKADPTEALFWYTVAASQKDADAAKRAGVLGKALGQATSVAVSERAKAWKVEVAPEAANVVSVNQPAWNASGTTG
jgi:localization factor PodJL